MNKQCLFIKPCSTHLHHSNVYFRAGVSESRLRSRRVVILRFAQDLVEVLNARHSLLRRNRGCRRHALAPVRADEHGIRCLRRRTHPRLRSWRRQVVPTAHAPVVDNFRSAQVHARPRSWHPARLHVVPRGGKAVGAARMHRQRQLASLLLIEFAWNGPNRGVEQVIWPKRAHKVAARREGSHRQSRRSRHRACQSLWSLRGCSRSVERQLAHGAERREHAGCVERPPSCAWSVCER